MTQWQAVHAYLLEHRSITSAQAAELLSIGKRRAGGHLIEWHGMGRLKRVKWGCYALDVEHTPKLRPGRLIQLALEARGEMTVAEVAQYTGMSRNRARNRLADMVDTGKARWVRFGVYRAVAG